jgi:hypothetical protein
VSAAGVHRRVPGMNGFDPAFTASPLIGIVVR